VEVDDDDDDDDNYNYNTTDLKEIYTKDVILAQPVLKMMQRRCSSLLSL
jgi:hypothetical protein